MRVSSVGAAVAGLAVAMIGTPSHSAGQAGRSDVQEGNRLYHEGRYDEAHERYLEALRAAPDSPVIRFNDANALYQSDEFARAVDAYRGAIEAADPVLEAQAWYNLGNALYRQQQVEGALEAYKEALRRNPGDADAKHNLEVALEQLQQQEQDSNSNRSSPGIPNRTRTGRNRRSSRPGSSRRRKTRKGNGGRTSRRSSPGGTSRRSGSRRKPSHRSRTPATRKRSRSPAT